ncbi:DNA primase [Algiphilus sp.]|uniref:DNA primase n=1 Tax=Algiphilus sp. TaxID=1872431 RepID=UPI0025BEE50F|nr:DNA primase [Algiphilus sp.]MCK5770541.1 DNA primase [Algiphilus sp.]
MAGGRIPESFISDLLARVDIVDVISPRVDLKRAGREWRGLSPFSNEKTPSFFVSPAKQMYFDFSSGQNGNAIGFLMAYERLDFVEAVEELARQLGLEVPREGGRGGPSRAATAGPLEALETAQRHFEGQLRRSQVAIDYLKRRGVDGATAQAFGIGFAPDSWDSLTRQFSDPRHALAAGLLIARDDDPARGCYDRFRNRLTFPIRDTRGRVIAFGGRTLGVDPAKYLNSPETDLFHKGRQLYGLYEARQAESHPSELFVVEGYMDVVGLARHGIRTAVATLGTATTSDHLHLLFRSTRRVVFCFDGDAAGRRAAWKALEQALPTLGPGREVRFMFLPDGHDPDSLVAEQGVEAWARALEAAQPLSRFLLDSVSAECDLTSPDGRAQLVSRCKPHLDRIEDAATRTAIVDALVPRTRLSHAELESILRGNRAAGAEAGAGGGAERRQKPVGRALQLLLETPALAARVADLEELAQAAQPGVDLLVAVLDHLIEYPDTTAAGLLRDWHDPEQRAILEKLARPQALPPADPDSEFDEIIARLRDRGRRLRVQELLDAAGARELSAGEMAELRALTAARAAAQPRADE